MVFIFTCLLSVRCNIKLPHILGSNMVLQREKPVVLWGWADPREKVEISFAGNTLSSKADKEGKWKMTFPSMKAGGPYQMTIKGNNIIQLENIMIGEVWICSGQSNMEWIVANSDNSAEEISKADFPEIRLFDVPNRIAFEPQEDISGGEWLVCSPATVGSFSAVGYFFGMNLFSNLNIPIGLISTDWGGTLIESWASDDALYTVPEVRNKVDILRNVDLKKLEAEQQEKSDRIRSLISGTSDGIVDGKALWAETAYDDSGWPVMKVPGLWEGSLLPSLDGVVWFRREVMIPEELVNTLVILSLGKIDDSDITWVNGIKTGETIAKYSHERSYHIPPGILKPGKNTITVRVEDTGGGGGFWSDDSLLYIKGNQSVVSLAGDWKFRISPVGYSFYDAVAGPNDYPSILYNSMIHPLLQYNVKGAIWYQGESNAGEAYLYRTLHPLMINNWREKWNNPDLVFLFVQLANFMQPLPQPANSEWAELREAQLMTVSTPHTGMAVAIDIGDADDIHPRNKQDVGYRLALAARKIAYNEDIVFSGPVMKSYTINGNRVEVEFDHTGSGLMAKDKYGYLKGFAIAGADKQFIWAKAYIEGNRVIVTSDKIDKPVAVRYAWADNPDDANLYNKEGLPASPFRTDNWKGITEK
ncbi:MAG: beta galactosidase jelly roll domain-containing protein [Bacteroidales bacterium]|nr:beta galactosidase jelly roll domain-containing protein [Bacteroidales bacterium]MBN2761651.1 beta galactosidase jelly roll domain-containing protein [Bacteroidales bacterium]